MNYDAFAGQYTFGNPGFSKGSGTETWYEMTNPLWAF